MLLTLYKIHQAVAIVKFSSTDNLPLSITLDGRVDDDSGFTRNCTQITPKIEVGKAVLIYEKLFSIIIILGSARRSSPHVKEMGLGSEPIFSGHSE